ncbi:PREDICTED: plasmolipin [Gekko japonicus]|uniref:Plasmolipin n=1 Tax=Gekko japonicus TaxID=146911 RepID=A0ABM1K3M0_GEKJA|nr:PREDICTED: plasmolipin [Gekko japonicus]
MADFPAKVSTRTSTPAGAHGGAGRSGSLDLEFLRSPFGVLMVVEIVLGCLVWTLIADTYYQPYPSYGWVMFVAVFFWMVTVILFAMYLFQLQLKLYMIPWPIVLLTFNVTASVLYATAFVTSATSVELYSWPHSPDYNRRAAASFFACLVMIIYGVSSCLSFRAWKGYGGNAATSQATISNHA